MALSNVADTDLEKKSTIPGRRYVAVAQSTKNRKSVAGAVPTILQSASAVLVQ